MFGMTQAQVQLGELTERVSQLQAECGQLKLVLSEQDAEVKALRLDLAILRKRLEESTSQADKSAAALFERIELTRGDRVRAAAPPKA